MGQHYKKSFAERSRSYKTEPAEDQFQAWAETNDVGFYRFGLDRPDFDYVPQMPNTLRAAPDFVAEAKGERFDQVRNPDAKLVRHFLVDAKGCGRDQTLKVKQDTINELLRWQQFLGRPVIFFFYDSQHRRISPLNPLDRVIDLTAEAESDRFPDNHRLYYKLTTDMFSWEQAAA